LRGQRALVKVVRMLVKVSRVLVEALGMPILAGECIVEAIRVSIIEFVKVPIEGL
jgi:hypothetical protein